MKNINRNCSIRKKILALLTTSVLTTPSLFGMDNIPPPHHQEATPKRMSAFIPLKENECLSVLEKFKDPSYIHMFKKDEYPRISKANIISNDPNTYVGVDKDGKEIQIESNKSKLDTAIQTLAGNPPTKAQIGKFGSFTDPRMTEIKSDITINKPIPYKRVALAALDRQNDDLLAKDPLLLEHLTKILEGTVVYNNADEIPVLENGKPTNINVVQNDLVSEAMVQYKSNPNAKMAIVIAGDSQNVGGGHPDGVGGTIEEAIFYVMPYLSPSAGVVAYGHGYPIPETGAMYISGADVMRDPTTYQILEKPFPVDLVFSVAPDLRKNKAFAITPEYHQDLDKRIDSQLKAAIAGGTKILLLGAWGCGVFENEQSDIIAAYKRGLEKYQGHFDKVVIVILDGPEKTRLNFKNEEVPNKNALFFEEFGAMNPK